MQQQQQQQQQPQSTNIMSSTKSSSLSLRVTQPQTTTVSLRSSGIIAGSILYLLLGLIFFINYHDGSAVVVLVQQPFHHMYLTTDTTTSIDYSTASTTTVTNSSSTSVDDEAVASQQQQQQQYYPLLRNGTSSRSSDDGPVHTIHQQQSIMIQKPHHAAHITYVTEKSHDSDLLIYKLIINAPCGNGMLVFNVGPAAVYEPYTYELYDDWYTYDNNWGLCFLFPSYTYYEISGSPMWSVKDEMELTVPLGDTPTRISTRIVIMPDAKHINTTKNGYLGGKYLIVRDGNFYDPMYSNNLKNEINHWPNTIMTQEEISMKLSQFMATSTTATA